MSSPGPCETPEPRPPPTPGEPGIRTETVGHSPTRPPSPQDRANARKTGPRDVSTRSGSGPEAGVPT